MKNVIEEILNSVTKPTRYVGNEWNSVHKSVTPYTLHNTRLLRIALAFPDLYEIGMSHLGMNILYHLLNEQDGVIAERVYAPWLDMEERLRHNKIPLFSLETRTPLKEFDIIGFSLQHEMCYTNVLTILDLAGIPLLARDRDDTHPLIIAGGACAFNPEPISEFIDLFVVGEAEEATLEIVNRVIELKGSGVKKQEILKELIKIEGVYIPSLYEVKYNSDGMVNSFEPKYNDVPRRIKKRTISDMDSVFCPVKSIVPHQSIVHDRAVVEVFRGCTHGCRFCHAGMISRPVRMRSLNRLSELVTQLMENTGWEEISLLGLNVYDYPEIEEIVSDIARKYGKKGVRISLPSLRPDNFSLRVAQLISMGVRARPILTFAPEAGTQRLRNIINKGVNEDELLTTMRNAFNAGWESCKLYFMTGLPGETDDDIKGIVTLVKELNRMGRKINPRAGVRLGVSPFVPKAHTPFQWEPQDKIEILRDKKKKITDGLRKTEVRWSNPESSFLEGIFARGDKKLNEVLLNAWKNGARFDAWTENFKFSVWDDAFHKSGIDPSFYLYRKRDYSEILPWDHIDTGVTKEFLVNENEKAKGAITTPNCMFEECRECGACDEKKTSCVVRRASCVEEKLKENITHYTLHLTPPVEIRQRIRITFSKGEELKYISHLDLQRMFTRALARAEITIAFSRGFHPHPEVFLGLPLSVGMTGENELCDVFLSERMEIDEFVRRLSAQLPDGLLLKKAEEIFLPAPPLPNIIKGVKYNVAVRLGAVPSIEEFLNRDEIIIHRKTPKSEKTLNIRPLIEDIKCSSPDSSGQFTFEISLKITRESSARPDEVITALLGQNTDIVSIVRREFRI